MCVDTDSPIALPALDRPTEFISPQPFRGHESKRDVPSQPVSHGKQEEPIKSNPQPFHHEHVALIYESLRPSLYASLRQHRLATEDIEDIIQEAFLRLIDRFPDNLLADNAQSWLFRVAYNLAIDFRRSGWKSASDAQTDFEVVISRVPDDRLNPEQIYLFAERRQRLQKHLEILSPRQRQAISLRITGLSCMEIAELLNSTPHSVEELIRRGAKRLQCAYRESKQLVASQKLSQFVTAG